MLAARTPADSLESKDHVVEFLRRVWSLTSTAIDHGEHHADHKPALEQLELELANMVLTLRGETIRRF
jgi:hypothetical protein